ncbi:RNA polymerase sigma factor [Danxiaibacter flavus]|uniref:RNA polymerase sigma factor n=1 Tax=Danxiaibacter flavus TaxID=3049108 RepID=A0ABV3ZQI9_9BACT|nr:RNA polymerase sigma factor [Chitinophagaceae bacterium DXS]
MEKSEFSSQLLQNETALKKLAFRLTSNSQDAADLHQETLFKALEYRNYYKNGTNIAPWLYVIMRNIFINMFRRKKRSLKLFQTVSDKMENRIDLSYGIENNVGAILLQIEKLPSILKTPLVLCVEGYKYTEIAELLDKPLGTIKSRIFFARKVLKNTIGRD